MDFVAAKVELLTEVRVLMSKNYDVIMGAKMLNEQGIEVSLRPYQNLAEALDKIFEHIIATIPGGGQEIPF